MYVITGPFFEPNIARSPVMARSWTGYGPVMDWLWTGYGPGQVHVPTYLFKLVYDERQGRAWAHWHLNDNATRGVKPISYAELVRRTGIEFLPGAHLAE